MTALAAGAGDADAVPGAGVRALEPVPLLRRPRRAGASWCAKGRAEFLAQFPSSPMPRDAAPPRRPGDPATFDAAKLDLGERERHAPSTRCTATCWRCGARTRSSRRRPARIDGAVLGERRLVLRFFGDGRGDDRLLIVNLGRDLTSAPVPEPLLAPPGARWATAVVERGSALRRRRHRRRSRREGNWRLRRPERAGPGARPARRTMQRRIAGRRIRPT